MSSSDDFLHGVDTPEHVGDVDDGYDLGLVGQDGAEVIHIKTLLGIELNMLQHGSRLACNELPWDDVAMMFHLADDDFIPLLQIAHTPRVRDQVDRLCCPAREHDLLPPRVHKLCDDLARSLVHVGSFHRQGMRPSVNIRVALLVELLHRLQHLHRLLARCRAIKIDKIFSSMHFLFQDGEIFPNFLSKAEARGARLELVVDPPIAHGAGQVRSSERADLSDPQPCH
mmetsp:Transcript_4837/g.17566  ORF Transcript_4837/g.17566 Transcript_4837/m.17566 type:complete len:227 (-) Transcript_4837:43-723(-)